MRERGYIACDLGAGSGRVILGQLREGKLVLEEVRRFESPPVKLGGTMRWDIAQIFEELKAGLRQVSASGKTATSVSVDSWGVDYVLFQKGKASPVKMPYHYRDNRTEAAYAEVMRDGGGADSIFEQTGIQFMGINTLYQLIAETRQDPAAVERADGFLNVADYLHYLLCGVGKAEESLASTTQIYDTRKHAWSVVLCERFGLPERLFPEVVPPGTRLGLLLPDVQRETGLDALDVVATCSHDTGAAVAAVPAEGDDWAFLSSGTWSLIGVELPEPLINEAVRKGNFTNEAGFGGTTRFLKNIVGLWLLQESQRAWRQQGQPFDYMELTRQAQECEPFRSLIDPADGRFVKTDDMPAKIAAFCHETDQPTPETPGQFTRCIFESLALLYADKLRELERLTGRTIRRLHVVGGGSNSALLNQMAANATGRTVLAGPVEATAAGNCLIQAIVAGEIESLTQARRIVRDSFPILEFQPQGSASWEEASTRFAQFTAKP